MLDILFPLQLDTLRGWWVLLSIVAIVLIILYVVVNRLFDDGEDYHEGVDADELVQQVTQDKKRNSPDLWSRLGGKIQGLWSSMTTMIGSLGRRLPSSLSVGGDISSAEYNEGDNDVDNDVVDTPSDDNTTVISSEETITITIDEDAHTVTIEDEILMTEETVDELEAQTRTALQREQFESEINYLRKRNKIDELEMKLIQGLAIDPEHPMVIETLAYHYVDQDQQKKSLPLFKKLIDLKPAYHKSLWQMGDIYVSSSDLDTAQVLVERALELSPNNPKYALTLVEIYYNRNQKEQAIRLMEDIVERRPENVSYRETLAKLYEEVNDYPLVVQCYESILLLDTKSTRIKKKLLEARTKLMK